MRKASEVANTDNEKTAKPLSDAISSVEKTELASESSSNTSAKITTDLKESTTKENTKKKTVEKETTAKKVATRTIKTANSAENVTPAAEKAQKPAAKTTTRSTASRSAKARVAKAEKAAVETIEKAPVKKEQKTTARREKKIEPKIFIEYYGKQICEDDIISRFYNIWQQEHKLSEIKSLNIYYKLEDDTAYCVVNQTITIAIKPY